MQDIYICSDIQIGLAHIVKPSTRVWPGAGQLWISQLIKMPRQRSSSTKNVLASSTDFKQMKATFSNSKFGPTESVQTWYTSSTDERSEIVMVG
jgi:hypothetical protein